ncbi:MAG: T9SS type A sorting domain-containing protein [Bacteroidales bacterium]|nr:T9SS type A sorting domain-containing protein [Bacteroidales bacterium]
MKKFILAWLSIVCPLFLFGQAYSCISYQFDSEGKDSSFAGITLYQYDQHNNTIAETFISVEGNIDSTLRQFDPDNRITYELSLHNGDSVGLKEWIYDTVNRQIFYIRSEYHNNQWHPRDRISSFGVKDFNHKLAVEHLGYDIYECDSFINESCKISSSEWTEEMRGIAVYKNDTIVGVLFPKSNAGENATATITYDQFGNISSLMMESPLIPGVDIITITQTFNQDNQLLIAERAQRFQEIDNMRNIRTERTYRNGVLFAMQQYGRTVDGWVLEKSFYYCNPLQINNAETDNTITLYPNPATDYFYIENSDSPSTLAIYDMQGKKHLQTDIGTGGQTIDIHHLASGLYVIILNNRQAYRQFKLIKK